MGKVKDMTGQVFGRLTVKGFSHVKNGYAYWICDCQCGTTKTVFGNCLRHGSTRSCGCLDKEVKIRRWTKHGQSKERAKEYRAWECMISRCNRTTGEGVQNYNGRGILVCERWRLSFADFLHDMGKAPSAKHSVDRIDNDGNYEPGNCRWATKEEQCRNTRQNHLITIDGVTKCLVEWVESAVVEYNTVLYRLRRGWKIKEALFSPPQKGKKPTGAYE